MNGQVRHSPAERSQRFGVHRTQQFQQPHPLRDRVGLRRIEPREAAHVRLAEREHLQQRPAHVHPANLRLGVVCPCPVAELIPQADARAGLCPPRAAGPLVRRRLRDRREPQAVHPDGGVELHLSRESGIDDDRHAIHSDGRFGDVRGQHDLPPVELPQCRVLLLRRQVAVKRQDRDALIFQGFQQPGRLADFAQPRQENQHVAGVGGNGLAHGVRGSRCHRSVRAARAVADVDREGPAFARHDWAIAEVCADGGHVEGG